MKRGHPPEDPRDVHRALLAVARSRRSDFNNVMVQYAIERFIDRLSRSGRANAFVLKGAMLFRVWNGDVYRPTRDVDFLGYGEPAPARAAEFVRSIAALSGADGLRFDPESVVAQEIRARQSYAGVRVTLAAWLAHVPIVVRLDVGFGDAVTPAARIRSYPTMLGHAPPVVRTYPPESAVAEKVEALWTLGLVNSRLKDYADLIVMSRQFRFDGSVLAKALRATFERRGTTLSGRPPDGLSDAFATDPARQRQWSSFLGRSGLRDLPESFEASVELVRAFVGPALAAAANSSGQRSDWSPHDGWHTP